MNLEEALQEIERLVEEAQTLANILANRFSIEGQEPTQEELDKIEAIDIHAINRVKYLWCNQCQGIGTA